MARVMTVGALCAGYGGLEMGLAQVLPVDLAWYAEVDPAPAKVMAHHHPDVPNHGDITTVDWASVEPVDVITAGYPCQPFSAAGKRKGKDDERHLWPAVAHAVGVLRPRLVLLENVAGHLRLGFDAVLGDLAALGYDATWSLVRASDVGAAHRRERLFVVASPVGGAHGIGGEGWRPAGLPGGADADLTLLPTPAVTDMGARKTVDEWDEWTARMRAKHGNGNGHGPSLAIEAQRLLPTPTATDCKASGAHGYGGQEFCTLTDATVRRPQDWGKYAAAIARHERALGRPAPEPTELGPKGGRRLSPRFVEFLMMLPDGHVTDPAIGLTRNAQLKALGNGVVPAQAAAAFRHLLALSELEPAA